MNGLMQPGPTLYEAEQRRKKKGSQGLLGAVGEPLSYAPGPLGAIGAGLLGAQYLTGEKPMEEGLSALAMMTGLLQGTKVAPIMRNAIKVYHGSPHKFDKPDSSKIGAGEGSQAYGHGLYWAESPDVAKAYKAMATAPGRRQQYNDPNVALDAVIVLNSKQLTGGDTKKFAELVKSRPGAFKDPEKLLKRIAEYDNDVPPSYLYEASLRWPDPAREAADPLSAKHFLDWDKPLSEQPESVRKALETIKATYGPVRGNKQITGAENGPLSGGTIVNDLASSLANAAGSRDVWRGATPISGQGKLASDALRQAGIPGITYLDAGSRAAGQGTRNYVTFDDALVELLKRNGGLLGK